MSYTGLTFADTKTLKLPKPSTSGDWDSKVCPNLTRVQVGMFALILTFLKGMIMPPIIVPIKDRQHKGEQGSGFRGPRFHSQRASSPKRHQHYKLSDRKLRASARACWRGRGRAHTKKKKKQETNRKC